MTAKRYESRDGERQTQIDKVAASQLSKEVFGNTKIRKAVALAVYPLYRREKLEVGRGRGRDKRARRWNRVKGGIKSAV